MSQKSWKQKMYSVTVHFPLEDMKEEASLRLKRLASPRPEGDRVLRAIERAARRSGIAFSRAYDLWYKKTRRVDAEEIAALRAAERTKHHEARNDLLTLAADFNALAERAARIDPEMVGPWVDAMRDIASQARRLADGD